MELAIAPVNAAIAALNAPRYTFGAFKLDCECEKTPEELAALERAGRIHRLGDGLDRIDCCSNANCLRGVLARRFVRTNRRSGRALPCCFCHIRRGERAPVEWVCAGGYRPAGGAMLADRGAEWYAAAGLNMDCCLECWGALAPAQLIPRVAVDPAQPCMPGLIHTMWRGPLPVAPAADPRPLLPPGFELRFELAVTPRLIVQLCGVDAQAGNIFSWLPICAPARVPRGRAALLVNVEDADMPVAVMFRGGRGLTAIVRVFHSLADCVALHAEWANNADEAARAISFSEHVCRIKGLFMV